MQQFVETLPNRFLGALASVGADVATGAYSTVGAMKYGVPEIMKRVPEEGWGAIGSGLDAATRMMPGGNYVADLQAAASDYATSQGVSPGAQMALGFLSPSLSDLARGTQGAVRRMAKGPTLPKVYRDGVVDAKGKPRPMLADEIDPFGFQKVQLDKPFDEIGVDVLPTEILPPRQTIDIADLEGKVAFPLVGDRSALGGLVQRVDGIDLARPVYREGGPDFMLGPASQKDGSVWASGENRITTLANRTRELQDEFDADVVGAYFPQAPEGIDYAKFTANTLAGMLPGARIKPGGRSAFNRDMRKVDRSFPGVGSERLQEWLDGASGDSRKAFVKLMEVKDHRYAGFPQPGAARKAVTDPALYGVNVGDTGFAFAQMTDDVIPASRVAVPHSTYDTQIKGEYLGGLDSLVPQELFYRDHVNSKLAAGKDPSNYRGYEMGLPAQKIDAELVDTISAFLERKRRAQR
jgi:hypothetical protein